MHSTYQNKESRQAMNPEELELDEASEYTITKPPYNEKDEREKCRR